MGKKYVAYVGTYTHGTSKGIQVYDVNLEEGTLTERSEVGSKQCILYRSIQEWQVFIFHRGRRSCGFQA